MTRRQKRIENLQNMISDQRKWLEPKILSVRPCDVHLFEGKYEPVPDKPNHFYDTYSGNGGSAIWKADHDRLVSLETEYEMLTGQRA